MPSGYHHLTHFERGQIHARLHQGLSKREIVRPLERDPTKIARETARHRRQRGYRHLPARDKVTSRCRTASAVPGKMTPERWEVVEERLKEDWSPEQVTGRFRQQGEVMAGREWIDQYIRAGRQTGGDLYRCLHRRGKQPNGRGGHHAGRGHIPGRVDMAERPAIVEAKSRTGPDGCRVPRPGRHTRSVAGQCLYIGILVF